MEFEFQYIDENLTKIIQNPDSVLYVKPYNVRNKRALFAVVKEDKGVYKSVQITKEQSKWTFPFTPIYCFKNGPGYIFLKDFMVFNSYVAININYLDEFTYRIADDNRTFNVGIFAVFNDGSATFINAEKAKNFEKQGGIKAYIDLLKQYKEYNPRHDSYQIIEHYSDGNDTFIIPELQKKTEEQPKVKKLTNDSKKQG